MQYLLVLSPSRAIAQAEGFSARLMTISSQLDNQKSARKKKKKNQHFLTIFFSVFFHCILFSINSMAKIYYPKNNWFSGLEISEIFF